MMKLAIFCACIVASLTAPQNYYYKPRPWAILRLNSDAYPDGSYYYGYDTENGISADEAGKQKYLNSGTSAQGSYRYTSPEGLPVQVQYVADENGYQPSGNVLPTSPPIPSAILRSIQYNNLQEQLHPSQRY